MPTRGNSPTNDVIGSADGVFIKGPRTALLGSEKLAKEPYMHGHSKVFTGDMRGAKKAAKEIIRLLPDIERAGATYFEFLIGGDGRRPFASAQILDVNDEPVSLPVKLGNS